MALSKMNRWQILFANEIERQIRESSEAVRCFAHRRIYMKNDKWPPVCVATRASSEVIFRPFERGEQKSCYGGLMWSYVTCAVQQALASDL